MALRRTGSLGLFLIGCLLLFITWRADDLRIRGAGLRLLRGGRLAQDVTPVEDDLMPEAGGIAMLSCWSGDVSANGKQSIAAKREYADYWNYTLHISVDEPTEENAEGSWNKVFALRRLMRDHPETEWFWVSDTDLLIMNPALSIEEHILGPLDLLPGRTNDTSTFLIIASDCNCLNAGSFLIRNDEHGWLFIDLLLDPLLRGMPYAEQDAMSHLFSHHKTLLDGVALVPLRMLNAYPPSSCPVTQVDFDPANGEWRWELTGHTLVIPGYEYGPAEYLGWNESPGPSNWVPYPPQVQVVDEDGNELEVRDQTAEEALEEYKDLVKQKGLPYDPLLLRTDGTPPSTAPGTEYAVNTKLSAEDKKKADWQWWNDRRIHNGQWHYEPGDFGVHLAGCWLVEGQCEMSWKHYFERRGSVKDLPPRDPATPRFDVDAPTKAPPKLGGLTVNRAPPASHGGHGGPRRGDNGTVGRRNRLGTMNV